MSDVFTPEQEARVREIVRDELATIAAQTAARAPDQALAIREALRRMTARNDTPDT